MSKISKNYKVIALAVSGRGKNIYKSGDIVSVDKFVEGTADEYVKTKHLEIVTEKKVNAKAKAKAKANAEKAEEAAKEADGVAEKAAEEATAKAEELRKEATDLAKKAK